MSMVIKNDHPFTDEEKEYLANCNRNAELEQNARDFPVEIEENDSDSYGSWKNAELKAEIDERNKLRGPDEQIPVGSNKAELVAALESDDAAHPEG
jgi:hypothetical protein